MSSKPDVLIQRFTIAIAMVGCFAGVLSAQLQLQDKVGGPQEPIRFIGNAKPDPHYADGGLPWAVGVQNYQVLRASRLFPKLSDGQGWTFHHAQMLAYWKGKFYAEFIASPLQENGLPTNVMMASSADGRHWSMPIVIFPQWNDFKDPEHPIHSQLHQRMGFYVAPNGKLLVISHYGQWNNEKNDIFGGPGFVVREVREDGSFGPIYFVRFGQGWSATNAPYPWYTSSPDKQFEGACRALLANKFVTDQWFELGKGFPADDYIQIPGVQPASEEARSHRKALSFFTRKDGTVVGIWKEAWTAISDDHGNTWSVPVQAPGVAHTFAKLWGQKTSDGRYALAYDPFDSPPGYRWPLVAASSNDGITFDHMLAVYGEVPYRRYPGLAKNNGPQYMRGIAEGNPQPPDGAMWMVFSVNKEDIWVTRIPVPIRGAVDAPVHDEFDNMKAGGVVTDWNVYSPRWAPVEVADFPSAKNKSLQLADGDPYDYARAVRVFPLSKKGAVSFKLMAKQANAQMNINLDSPHGKRPVRIILNDKGEVDIANGSAMTSAGKYISNQWMTFTIDFDCGSQTYSVRLDGKSIGTNFEFAESASALQRFSLQTGPYRAARMEQSGAISDNGFFTGSINPRTDHPLKTPAVYYVDSVITSGKSPVEAPRR